MYYKGILAFIFYHIMVQDISCNNYKTQEQIEGTRILCTENKFTFIHHGRPQTH